MVSKVNNNNDNGQAADHPQRPVQTMAAGLDDMTQPGTASDRLTPRSAWAKLQKTAVTFAKFIGPGFMIAVAYSTCLLPLG